MSTESYRRSRGQPLRAVIEAEVAPAASPRAIEFVHVRRLLAFFPGIWVGGLLALAVLAGAVLRLAYVLPADFPLNDGGLFYVMVRDLQEAHYLLPSFTSYNNADIPFAYPPFSFYLAGLLDDAGPWDLLSIFRFLPLVFSVLTIPAFFWLCRSLFNSSRLDSLSDHRSADTRLVLLATFFFAVMPRSFKWEIVGGGLTRSIGFFLAILFLHQLLMALQSGKKLHTGAAAVLLGLTLLSHPEMSVFAMYSGALFWLFTHRSLQTLWTSALVFVGGFILALPWLIEVIGTHGLGPYLAAMSTGEGVAAPWDRYAFMTFSFSEEPYVPFLAVLGFVGFLSCLAQRKFLLPLWLTLVFVLDARKAPTLAMVPMAMLIAIALDYLAVLSESRLKFDLRRLHRLPRLLGLLPWLLVAPVVALVVLFFLRFDLGLEIATFPAMKWTGILTAAALLPWLAVLIALHQARERAVHALFSPINLLGLALPFLLTPLWFWEMFDFSFRRSCINVLLLAGLGLVGLGSLAIRTFPSWSIRLPGLSLIKVIPVHSVWAVLVLLLVGSYSIVVASPRMNQYPPLHVLSSDSRQAMEWIKHNVPEDSAFLVITGQYGWWGDAENEWFPLLAGRQSLDTVQGYEWVPDDKFLEMIDEYYYLQSCAWDDVSCLDDWAYDTGKNFSHVYISAGADTWSDSYCCWWLRSSLLNSPRYEIVYNNDSVTIFSLREEFRGQHYRYSSSYSYQSDYGSLPYSSSGDGSSGFPSYP